MWTIDLHVVDAYCMQISMYNFTGEAPVTPCIYPGYFITAQPSKCI